MSKRKEQRQVFVVRCKKYRFVALKASSMLIGFQGVLTISRFLFRKKVF